MSGKICQDCRKPFEPSRESQRFCSIRCGNRQRDRRRRNRSSGSITRLHNEAAAGTPAPNKDSGATRLTAALSNSHRSLDSLRAQLRSQSADVDELEAENTEQGETIKTLRGEIARLCDIQQSDTHDLIHLAGRLLALGQATGAELDAATKDLFRRRGWTTAAHKAEAR